MQGGTSHELHVVVALTQHPYSRFSHDGKRLDEQILGFFTVVEPGPELPRLGPQRVVAQHFDLGLEGVDVGH